MVAIGYTGLRVEHPSTGDVAEAMLDYERRARGQRTRIFLPCPTSRLQNPYDPRCHGTHQEVS